MDDQHRKLYLELLVLVNSLSPQYRDNFKGYLSLAMNEKVSIKTLERFRDNIREWKDTYDTAKS